MYYRLATYIVTSKPKRISVASGLVHIMFLLVDNKLHTFSCTSMYHYYMTKLPQITY